MSRKTPPEVVAAALAAVATGRSLQDVAREFGVSAPTVLRWRQAAELAAQEEPPPIAQVVAAITAAPALGGPEGPQRALAGLPDLPPIPEGADTLERARAMLARVDIIAEHSLRQGNLKAAQSAMRDGLKALNDIARYETQQAKRGDGLHISQEEIDESRETVRARFAALADRPLLCAHCGRKLAISWGEHARKETEA